MYSKRVILGKPEGSPEGFVCEIDRVRLKGQFREIDQVFQKGLTNGMVAIYVSNNKTNHVRSRLIALETSPSKSSLLFCFVVDKYLVISITT